MNYILSILIALLVGSCASTSEAAQSVSLAWDASCSGNVVGYNIYYGAGTNTIPTTNVVFNMCGSLNGTYSTNISYGSYSNKISVGNVTNTTISGLIEGETYCFACSATDSWGLESDISNETRYKVPRTKPNHPNMKPPK